MSDSYLGAITWYWGALQMLPSPFRQSGRITIHKCWVAPKPRQIYRRLAKQQVFPNFSQCSFCKNKKRKSKILAYSDHISDAYRWLTIISYIILLYQKLHHSPSSIQFKCLSGAAMVFTLFYLLTSELKCRCEWVSSIDRGMVPMWNDRFVMLHDWSCILLGFIWLDGAQRFCFGGAYQLGTRIFFRMFLFQFSGGFCAHQWWTVDLLTAARNGWQFYATGKKPGPWSYWKLLGGSVRSVK